MWSLLPFADKHIFFVFAAVERFTVLGSCFSVCWSFGSVYFYWGSAKTKFFATIPKVEMVGFNFGIYHYWCCVFSFVFLQKTKKQTEVVWHGQIGNHLPSKYSPVVLWYLWEAWLLRVSKTIVFLFLYIYIYICICIYLQGT